MNWRPVIWGLGLQFLLGVTILRWTAGYTFFNFLGMQVKVFLDYADEGSKFVFGEDTYMEHPMAFKVGRRSSSFLTLFHLCRFENQLFLLSLWTLIYQNNVCDVNSHIIIIIFSEGWLSRTTKALCTVPFLSDLYMSFFIVTTQRINYLIIYSCFALTFRTYECIDISSVHSTYNSRTYNLTIMFIHVFLLDGLHLGRQIFRD